MNSKLTVREHSQTDQDSLRRDAVCQGAGHSHFHSALCQCFSKQIHLQTRDMSLCKGDMREINVYILQPQLKDRPFAASFVVNPYHYSWHLQMKTMKGATNSKTHPQNNMKKYSSKHFWNKLHSCILGQAPTEQSWDKLCFTSDLFLFCFNNPVRVMCASTGRNSSHPYELLSSGMDSKALRELKGSKGKTQSLTTRGERGVNLLDPLRIRDVVNCTKSQSQHLHVHFIWMAVTNIHLHATCALFQCS